MKKEEKQFKILLEVLGKFQAAGILQEIMLIGSWCLYFYRLEFEKEDAFAAIRTLDVDFLISNPQHMKAEADLPSLLKDMGFVPTFNRSSGLVVYDHEELRVEFLVPELGKGGPKARDVKKLHVKAVALRYLNMLMGYPKVIDYEHLRFKVPEPAAFALHKLIVSSRRLKKEKAAKDLEMAVGLLEFLYKKRSEREKVQTILKALPKAWVQTILSVSAKYFPELNQDFL